MIEDKMINRRSNEWIDFYIELSAPSVNHPRHFDRVAAASKTSGEISLINCMSAIRVLSVD